MWPFFDVHLSIKPLLVSEVGCFGGYGLLKNRMPRWRQFERRIVDFKEVTHLSRDDAWIITSQMLGCFVQNSGNRVGEGLNHLRRELSHGGLWRNPRGPEYFIGIGIADSSDQLLID